MTPGPSAAVVGEVGRLHSKDTIDPVQGECQCQLLDVRPASHLQGDGDRGNARDAPALYLVGAPVGARRAATVDPRAGGDLERELG